MDNDLQDVVEDFLAHYGVLGMKWGVRKKSKRPSSSGPNKEKIAKRKAKSDKILQKAKRAQSQLSELETKGVHSTYMLKKYGPNMGIDTRAADMKIVLLNNHSKEALLAAEKKGLAADVDHYKKDAKAASEGRLTSSQKMLIGGAVAVGILAVAYGLGTRKMRLNAKALDAIKPGQSINYGQFWKKMENTEMSRVGAISKDAFNKMDDAPINVPAGTVFHRISTSDEQVLRDRVYASFKDDDVTRYKAALPTFWDKWGGATREASKKGGFDVSIKATEDIVSPSQKARVQALIDLMDEPIKGKDYFGLETTQTGKQWLKDQNMFVNIADKAEDIALKEYNVFAGGLVQDTPLNTAYFNKLKSKGFNAIIDDNDARKLSDAPMLIFDTSKSMQRIGATKLTPEMIAKARESLIELATR